MGSSGGASAGGTRDGAEQVAPWLDPQQDLESRVAALVADLAGDDAVAVALGDGEPLVRRGVPDPRYVDAGTGLRGVVGATAFPAGIALAATFDAVLAERYGAAVGSEARTAGFTVLLGPTLDLARDPRGGRIAEAFGEDAYLAGLLGAAHVRGAQSTHLVAQLKHYVAYNGEERRTGEGPPFARSDSTDVRVSSATLHDVYLRPFAAAVAAGAWSMMTSYNRINGRYVAESPELLDLPRREWGWTGFTCPDFLFAVRDDAAALAAGLDLPSLGGPAGRTAAMLASPDLPAGHLDRLVGNVVRALVGSGLVDDPPPAPADLVPESSPSAPSTPDHRDLAHATAVAGTVLLRNERGALPFGGDVRSVAVVGPAGDDALFVGGGAAAVTVDPARAVSPLRGLRDRAGDGVRVDHAQGSLGDVPLPVVPAGALGLPDGTGPGVLVETRSGRTSVVPVVDHGFGLDEMAGDWPHRWTTRLTPTVSGRHRLSLTLGGRATVRVDGRVVLAGARELERFVAGPRYSLQGTVDLVAGEPALVEIEFEIGPAIVIPPEGLGPSLRLGWQPPDRLLDDAVATAAAADVAVVVVNVAAGEGMDRDGLELPGDQDELVARVAAASPRTVVVLNSPGAVLMPWLDDVDAVVQVWYPGERFGTALAAVLFGDADPGGRLPLTFPRDRAHLPGGDHGPAGVRGPADQPADQPADGLAYDEGTAIGYRAEAVRRHGALFAFGAGLSYADTTCEVAGAAVVDGALHLRLAARNRSPRAATHVAQVYAAVGGGEDRELVAVARLPLDPDGSAERELTIAPEAFARWDGAARRPVEGVSRVDVTTASDRLGTVVEVEVRDGRVVGARLVADACP